MYRCEVCTTTSQAGEPLLKRAFFRRGPRGPQISLEVKLCRGCKARLDAGEAFDALVREAQASWLAEQDELRQVAAAPINHPVAAKPKRWVAVPL